MSSSRAQFQPHGLITTPALHVQYLSAHIESYDKAIHDPKEFQTLELLENILNKVVFSRSSRIFINFQQPPGIESRKACDLVVKYAEADSFQTQVLCFVKCERSEETSLYSLKALEQQALGYCKEYCSIEGKPFIHAATAYGAHVRLWKYPKGNSSLFQLWGSEEEGHWEHYKDVGVNEDGALLLKWFTMMASSASSLAEGQVPANYASEFAHLGHA